MGRVADEREAAAMPLGPSRGALVSVRAVGALLEVDTAAARAQVSVDGGQPVWLPYMPADYTDVATVEVLRNPLTGRCELVMGPCGAWDTTDPEVAPAPSPPGPAPSTKTVVVTITPTWSGTWSGSPRNRWDTYNVTRDELGGRSTLYQGDPAWHSALVGLACYGSQLTNLGATAITAARLTVRRPRTGSTSSVALVVQGAPHASRPSGAPSPSGPTASVSLPYETTGHIDLGSTVREGLRTGSVRSLALVGSTYAGVYGTSRSDGMVLRVTATVPA